MKGNKPKTNKKRFLYPDEYEKVMDFLNRNGKFTAKFIMNTGARINEARGFITNPIIDNQRENLILTQTKVRARLKETRPSPRTIPVSKRFFRELKVDLTNHRVLSTNAFNIQLKTSCKKAKITNPEEFSSHNLRKTFATWLLSLGVDGFRLAQHLGHSPNELFKDYATNDVFNHKDKQIMRKIFGNLPERIS